MRNYSEAERYYQLAAALAPEAPAAHRDLLRVRLATTGDTLAARDYLERLPRTLTPRVRITLEAELAYYRRDFERALRPREGEGPGGGSHERLAILYHLMGDQEMRDLHADSLRIVSEATLAAARANPGPVQTGVVARAHAKLGIAYALLGEGVNASMEGSSAVIHLPVFTDAYEGAEHVRDLAVIYALIGAPDLALEQLETALMVPSPVTRVELELDPLFDAVRELPGFQELVLSQGQDQRP
jgi:hypothetical protein